LHFSCNKQVLANSFHKNCVCLLYFERTDFVKKIAINLLKK
jgi:hypothetical protein